MKWGRKMEYQYIETRVQDRVGIITLNRPRELNALNREMVRQIGAACQEMAVNPEIRALIITGEPHFAAGADIGDMLDLSPEKADGFSFRHVMAEIENLPKPVIAAMQGYALGAGLELALVCDLRIASPEARFGLPEIKLGIFPGAGGTIRLPRLIGPAHAKMMIYTGNMIDAPQAMNWGLIDIIEADPLEAGLKLATALTCRPPVALKLAKRCINQAFEGDAASAIEMEALAWQHTFSTKDQKEGMRGFLEKRTPVFSGE